MKKIIENTMVSLNNPLRAVRLLIVLLGVIGVLLSCGPAEESAGGGGGVSIPSDFSAADVSVTFGTETGSVEIDITDPSAPILVISGITNADDTATVEGTLTIITERPEHFTTATTSIDFDDADGFRTTSTSLENLIVTNLSTDAVVTYAVRIDFTGAPVSDVVTEDLLIATFTNITLGAGTQTQTGTLTLTETTIEIAFLNPVGDGLTSGVLMASVPTGFPEGYSFSAYSNDFDDPSGIGATTQTVSTLTISEVDSGGVVVNGNSESYTITIVYEQPNLPLEAMDVTAIFGNVEGAVQIDETNITITGLNNYDDSLVDSNNNDLEFSIAIADATTPAEFTIMTPFTTTSLTNGVGDLVGIGETTNIALGTLTITLDVGLVIDYPVSVRFAGPLELRVSGDVVLPPGDTNITILEGDPTASITANPCSEALPTFVVATNGVVATGYTVDNIDASLPYVLDRTTSTDTKDATLDVLRGDDIAGTFSFDYIVSCTDSNLAGSGTVTDPYQISSASRLDLVSYMMTQNTEFRTNDYVLSADINLGVAGAPWAEGPADNPGAGFNSISFFFGQFNCEYSGISYSLSNLFINKENKNEIGLMSVLGPTGSVSNCNLENAKVIGSTNVGVLVGANYGTISSNTVAGEVIGSGSNVGGLVGLNNSSGDINDNTATVTVKGLDSNVGGLVGFNNSNGAIIDSTASGTVMGSGNNVGGLVGFNGSNGAITDSTASGTVTGSNENVGGLVGLNNSSGDITDSTATGSVNGGSSVGGLIGSSFLSSGAISNSLATGDVTGSDSNVGGLVGFFNNGSSGAINDSAATGVVKGSSSVGGLVGQLIGNINNSYATGNVTGANDFGGLIGRLENGMISNVYSRGVISRSSSSALIDNGGLIGIVSANSIASIINSYTVSTGAVRSFVGVVRGGAALTVTHSYALTGDDGLGFTPTTDDSSSEQSKNALMTPIAAGVNATDLYFGWNPMIWDFGAATELPILSGLPAEFVQATD